MIGNIPDNNQITLTIEPFLWPMPSRRIRYPKPHLYPLIVEAFRRIWTPDFLRDNFFSSAEIDIVNGGLQVTAIPDEGCDLDVDDIDMIIFCEP